MKSIFNNIVTIGNVTFTANKTVMCVQLKSKFRNKIFIESFWRWLTKISDPLFFQGKAEGQRSAVWIRARLQDQLSQLGYFLQRHAGKVLFLAIVALATFCVALKSAQIHSKVEQLWVQGEYLSWNIFRKCIVIFFV